MYFKLQLVLDFNIMAGFCRGRLSGRRPTFSVKCRTVLRGSLPKSGPLDFATKNTFALFFVGEEALVGVY